MQKKIYKIKLKILDRIILQCQLINKIKKKIKKFYKSSKFILKIT